MADQAETKRQMELHTRLTSSLVGNFFAYVEIVLPLLFWPQKESSEMHILQHNARRAADCTCIHSGSHHVHSQQGLPTCPRG